MKKFFLSMVVALLSVVSVMANNENLFTIRTQFGDGTSQNRYLVINASGDLEATLTKPADDDLKGQWYVSDGSIKNAETSKYLGIDRGFKIYTEVKNLTLTAGTKAGTNSITAGNVNGAVKNDGTLQGGQYTNQKYAFSGGWTSDFVLEKVGESETNPETDLDYTVDIANGGLYRDGTTLNNTGWTSVWKSQKSPELQFTANANNMTSDGNNIKAETGNASNATYTIVAPTGYKIASYSFDIAAKDGAKTVEFSMGSNTFTTSATARTISATDVNEGRVAFTLKGTNGNSTILSNFKVTLVPMDPADIITMETVFTRTNNIDYRIPAVAKNKAGDLIFVADYRYSGKDIGLATNGKLDLHYRIKRANGEWGPVKTLAKCIETPNFTAFGDPCIVADRESNRILVTSCSGNVSFPAGTHDNHQGWARFYSNDGGENWTEFEDISDQVFKQLDKRSDGQIRCFFIGSGKITQSSRIKNGQYFRLYCAALVRVNDGTKANYVFYSDNFGETWNLLGDVNDCPLLGDCDEPKADELPDGSIILSSRTDGRLFNIFHFDNIANGTGKWSGATKSNAANNGCFGAGCNGEIMIVPVVRKSDNQKTYLALQSIPAASSRDNVSIYYKELTDLNSYRNSTLFAPTWTKFQVSNTASGYSTMCLDKDNNVAFFLEEDFLNPGYNMKYCKLSIEQITGKKYSYSELDETERAAYLKNGASAYFETQSYATEAPYAALINAYVANPTDDNYCALNAELNLLPSVNAQECPLASPVPVNGKFDASSKAYTMQIKSNIYITTASMTDNYFNTNNTTAPSDEEGYWVIAGSLKDGYQIYNVGAGAGKVLGVSGAEGSARTALYDVNNVPDGVNTVFDYHANTASNSTTGATFFIRGTDNNALNVRAPYLALWNSAGVFTDNGSRIELVQVEYDFVTTGLDSISASQSMKAYDIQGRPVNSMSKSGMYIIGSRKVVR